jgi:hypothetical protein
LTKLRRQGIYGESLPTKKSKNVEPSDFLIGGIVGFFERKFIASFQIRNPEEFREIFGENVIETYYGWDSVSGFFANVVGVDAKLFVSSYVGNDGAGTVDAVVATGNAEDGAAADVLKIDAAYKANLEYGISGNRTGYTIEKGDRFTTASSATGTSSDLFILVDSVADVKNGDIIKVVATGGGGATVYKKVTSVDEGLGRINFTGAFDGAANIEVDDVVTVEGFRIKTYRKTLSGIVNEVDTELGESWCTLESDVTDYYVENVFANSKKISVTYLAPATGVGATYFPAEVSTVTYLSSGADGTSPASSAYWTATLAALDEDPIRLLCNPETTDETVQKALETYCRGRNDLPKVLYNFPEDQTKSQLITRGNNFQRSDDVLGVIVANWFEKEDTFSTSLTAPKRKIPSCALTMGLWIRSMGTNGIHWVPAVASMPYFGVTDVVGEISGDLDRTDIAQAGVNIIRNVRGTGIILKSFYTPSITKEFQFGNGIMMREYIKVSIIDSLELSLNEPNNYARIQASRSAVILFFNNLWRRGSTGNAPEGETFGQTFDPETSKSTKESDHYEVQADFINNPQSSIENGERNIDSWFTYPSPAGSIKIGVGLMLLG